MTEEEKEKRSRQLVEVMSHPGFQVYLDIVNETLNHYRDLAMDPKTSPGETQLIKMAIRLAQSFALIARDRRKQIEEQWKSLRKIAKKIEQ